MARLRIRVELNRGGVGVPLHKLASVVDEAQKFFHMLAEDVQIDRARGEWLGFDFDHESLNFTAEFVGPVTADQVSSFNAAFDGTTQLRRVTIGQFAHIAEAIGEDEVIGFGLFVGDESPEPGEWRCLSRRDALRISEEIQMLIGASEEQDFESHLESHLPAVAAPEMGARIFSERRDRSIEAARWASAVREMESNLTQRIDRVEQEVDQHSGQIQELRTKSTTTEESMRSLLSAVESFCAHAARQIEAIAPLAALPAPAPPFIATAPPAPAAAAELAHVPEPAPAPVESPALSVPAPPPVSAPLSAPVLAEPSVAIPDPAPITVVPPTVPMPDQPGPVTWRRALVAAGVAIVAITSGVLLWPAHKEGSKPAEVQASTAATGPAPPVQSSASAPVPAAQTPARERSHVELSATELTWVSITEADGTRLLARLFMPGDVLALDLQKPATMRVGNAGGLGVRFNGNSVGSLGDHGMIREVQFKDGSYKILAFAAPGAPAPGAPSSQAATPAN